MLPIRLVALLAMLLVPLHTTLAADDPYVPPDLESWVPWVLEGKDYRQCPFFGGRQPTGDTDFLCAWPGRLELDVSRTGMTFRQRWSILVESDVGLPGNVVLWPEDVSVDGRPSPVTIADGGPALRLTPGDHVITGLINWQRRPATVPLPQQAGLVQLTIDGKIISAPQRNGNQIWLGDRQSRTVDVATITPVVYRKLGDGLPATLLTRLQLQVSGPEREELLGRILPAGFQPMSLDSPLPARIEPDGRLRLQLRPGYWEITLAARANGLVENAGFEKGDGVWPDEEVWSFQGNERLRVTQAQGNTPLDPARAGVPANWQHLPAFRLTAGERLLIEERSRGQDAGIDNRLQLQRSLWLDFDGTGFTAVDHINGQMSTDWRLGMATPWQLAGATIGGEPALVTRGPEDSAGIEVRDRMLNLTAIGRLETGGETSVSGWQSNFDNVGITVNLPPGFRLIAAPGADASPAAWASRWQLMDYFLLLLIAGAIGRLVDWRFGLLAGLMLIITWQEPGAPIVAWLAVAIGVALAKHAPEGRLRRWSIGYRNLALAGLMLISLPFAGQQLTQALFPQLDNGPITGPRGPVAGLRVMPSIAVNTMEFDRYTVGVEEQEAVGEVLQRKARRAEDSAAMADKVTVTGSRISQADLEAVRRYAPGTLVQTGPGIPEWRYVSYPLSWSGPVSERDMMRLIILGDGSYRLLRIVGVLLIALLVWRLVRLSMAAGGPIDTGRGASAATVLLAAMLLSPFQSGDATNIPDPLILEELQRRLLEPPDCAPSCSEISRASVTVTGDRMTIELSINAKEDVAVAVPGKTDSWRPSAVLLDGNRTDTLLRHRDVLYARIPAGLHRLSISGAMPKSDELRLPFPRSPHHITVMADGWSIAGVREGRLPGGTLQLTRIGAGNEKPGGTLEPRLFPPFVRVTRTLTLGLDWIVTTTVERLAPARAGFSVTVPLLPGEAVMTDNMDIGDDHSVVLRFSANESTKRWSSSLETTPNYVLEAGDADDRQEVWRLTVSALWRVGFAGTPMLAVNEQMQSGVWVAEFQPRAGEKLELEASRPEGIEGATLVFDEVRFDTEIGRRASESTFSATYRSTRGGPHTLAIPPDATVLSVQIDNREIPLSADQGKLQFPVTPGTHHMMIRWSTDEGISTHAASGLVDLGAAAANIRQVLAVGEDRWVLFTTGPRVGPAVLYWSELAVFVLLALGLARIGYTPLRFHHWLLLGIGFSTFSWGVLLLVGAWLFATAAREKLPMPEKDDRFNLVQIGYAVFTVIVLASLLQAVPRALLGSPDMHVAGNASMPSQLNWFSDRVDGLLPGASVVSLPMWVYKAAILAWALWLAFALLKWLPWAWRAWNTGGLWRGTLKVRTGWKSKKSQETRDETDDEG